MDKELTRKPFIYIVMLLAPLIDDVISSGKIQIEGFVRSF